MDRCGVLSQQMVELEGKRGKRGRERNRGRVREGVMEVVLNKLKKRRRNEGRCRENHTAHKRTRSLLDTH